jgi:drug/metabolite transporter (DMT)-like permease
MLLGGMPAMRLTELRSAGAFLGLLVLLALARPRSLRVSARELPMLAVFGVAGFALVQWLYFVAILRLPVAIALLLEYTAPLLVALWVRFVGHERMRRRLWVGLALALAGLSLVAEVWGGVQLDTLGVVAALGAAVSLAVYFLVGEHSVSSRDPLSLTCYAFGFSTLLWTVVQPWWTFPWSVLGEDVSMQGNLAGVQVPMWVLAIWLVLLGTIVPFSLIIGSLQHLRATQAGIVGMTEPVVATLVAFAWLGEALGPAQLLGGAVVLCNAEIRSAATSRPRDGSRRRWAPPD